MPSRIIKESITTSESLSEVSAEAERLFWRLVVKADDFGLYYGNPRILASMCFPLPVAFDNTCNHSNGKQVKSKSPVNENENGNENEERGTGTRPTGAAATPRGFDRFWAAYPRRVGKQDALKAWGQLNPDDALVDQIVAGVERWKTCDQWTKDGGSFICYPATFIRGRRWEEDDRPDPPPASPKGAAPKNYAGDEDFLEGR